MEVDEYYRCIFCNYSFNPSVLMREFFCASLTLEKTLDMLWERIVGFEGVKVNTKQLFDVLTNEDGNLFCFPCLAVLHSAMEIVAKSQVLEERLCSLSRRIKPDQVLFSYQEVNLSQDQQTNNVFDDRSGSIETPEHGVSNSIGVGIPMRFDGRTDSENNAKVESEESQERVGGLCGNSKKRRHSVSSQEDNKRNSTEAQSNNKKNRRNTASSCSAPLNTKARPIAPKCTKISCVQKCLSCDYKVDIRTLEQAGQSLESNPEILELKSRYMLLEHCRDVHLSVSAMAKFPLMNKIMRKGMSFKCVDCPFKATEFNMVVLHYTSVHVPQHSVEKRSDRFSLSCPEEGCSFVSIAGGKPGCTLSPDSDREVRDTLSTHVIKDHDRLELPAKKYEATRSLIVITEDDNREFQCTRCDYDYRLPSLPGMISPTLLRNSRREFLKHFFDVHLKDLVFK